MALPEHSFTLDDLDRLRRVAHRYEALASADGSVVWVVDPQLRPTGRNAAWERYSGQHPDDYRELGWLSAVHPDERDRFRHEAARAIASSQPLTLEFRLRRADGHFRRNLIRAIPVSENGRVVEWIGTATDIEDARQAADDLAAMEERLRQVHATAGIGTWEWHFASNELRWSPEIYRLAGFDPSERADPAVWVQRIHPEDRDAEVLSWTEALHRGDTHFTAMFRLLLPDLTVRWILASSVIFRDPEGKPIRAVGLNMDVTGQRVLQQQMEAALAEQRDLRARLLALTDGAESLLMARDEGATRAAILDLTKRVLPGDAYAIWSSDAQAGTWRILESSGLSEGFARIVVESNLMPLSHPMVIEDVQQSESLRERRFAYAAEGIKSMLTVPLPIQGERSAALVIYYRTPHQGTETESRVGMALGQIAAGTLANAANNAAQDRAQQAAERQALRMALLADSSAVLGSLEYEQTLTDIARLAVARITDWCAVDIVQSDGSVARIVTSHRDPAKTQLAVELHERYPPDLDAPSGLPRVLRTGGPEFYDVVTDDVLVLQARDEEHLRILRELGLRSALIAPLTARGRTLGAITFVSASVERAISRDDATVLMEVARRAALAVDNARLYRDLQAANQSKDDFLALLSHELRTPLNAIMGWSHMLRQGLPPDMQQHAVDVISRNAQSQKQLVEDLLDVARIAGGRMDLQRTSVDLRDLARAAVESALPSAQAKGLALALELARDPVLVSGDVNRLQQVALNLLSNAIKFTERGGRITIRVAPIPDGALISVTDTGVGIPREFLPHVFDRFRQADTSLSRSYSGLGLGLWVVREIIEAHDGRVAAESEGPGTGCRISVILPATQPAT